MFTVNISSDSESDDEDNIVPASDDENITPEPSKNNRKLQLGKNEEKGKGKGKKEEKSSSKRIVAGPFPVTKQNKVFNESGKYLLF